MEQQELIKWSMDTAISFMGAHGYEAIAKGLKLAKDHITPIQNDSSMELLDKEALVDYINAVANDIHDRGHIVSVGTLVILRDEIESGKFDATDHITKLQESVADKNEHIGSLQLAKEHEIECHMQSRLSYQEQIFKLQEANKQLESERDAYKEVLEWIRDAGTDYQSINRAASILSQYRDTTKE